MAEDGKLVGAERGKDSLAGGRKGKDIQREGRRGTNDEYKNGINENGQSEEKKSKNLSILSCKFMDFILYIARTYEFYSWV